MGLEIDHLILSKSLALVDKTHKRVRRIDVAAFPTSASSNAKGMIERTLQMLGDPDRWSVMSAEALYRALINLQDFVDRVEASTSDRISWPFVSYCDQLWRRLFPNGTSEIFYSVFAEHNYGIHSFSYELEQLLIPLLPPDDIKQAVGEKKIFCLQIASLEDENLPLYANIGHEFGHALYWDREENIMGAFDNTVADVFSNIVKQLNNSESALRCLCALRSMATEIFCDMVGALISGPAFMLSLHEMGWGSVQRLWSVGLTAKNKSIRAYPSNDFRIDCVKRSLLFTNYIHEVEKHLRKEGSCPTLTQQSLDFTIGSSMDSLRVSPASDPDAKHIETALLQALPNLRNCFSEFSKDCYSQLLSKERDASVFETISPEEVAKLLARMDADILPNIVPNGTLLGAPASFAAILNAASLFRIMALGLTRSTNGKEAVSHDIQKIERLTAKALEVSYVQKTFREWEKQPSVKL